MLRAYVLLFLSMACACGGEAASPEPGAGTKAGGDAPAQAAPGGQGDKAEAPTPPTREVKVTIKNRTSGALLLVKDYQAPLWLEIGTPPLMLNGYGQSWCGAKSYGHNEPAFLRETIPAGGSISAKWSGLFVTFDDAGSCWRYESAPSGSLPAKACIYEGTDTPGGFAGDGGVPFPAGPGPKGPPSTWFKNPPTRCIPLTIELKDGGSSVEVTVDP